MSAGAPDVAAVEAALRRIQDGLCAAFAGEDGQAAFREDVWTRPEGGGGRTRVLAGGAVFEQAGVGFSHVHGAALPPAATAQRPELAGRAFRALGVSVVVHPRNPYVPTSHANVRFFVAERPDEPPVWWFGGGFDLTPYYPFHEDAVAWHRAAREVCGRLDEGAYARFKAWCDEYFFLRHRGETRGVGGLFFDDLTDPAPGGFARIFAFWQAVAETYREAYLAIVRRRREHPWSERERDFQLLRRGRYVEFNLLYDRGTLFGLQSGGRTESILMSLPPQVAWRYGFQAEPGSAEARLAEFLRPRDWLAEGEREAGTPRP